MSDQTTHTEVDQASLEKQAQGLAGSLSDFFDQERKTTNEQQPDFKPCPFCGGAASTGHSIFTKSVQDFFSVACVDCGSRLGDFRDIEKAVQCWNERVYTNDEAKIIISSRMQQIRLSP